MDVQVFSIIKDGGLIAFLLLSYLHQRQDRKEAIKSQDAERKSAIKAQDDAREEFDDRREKYQLSRDNEVRELREEYREERKVAMSEREDIVKRREKLDFELEQLLTTIKLSEDEDFDQKITRYLNSNNFPPGQQALPRDANFQETIKTLEAKVNALERRLGQE